MHANWIGLVTSCLLAIAWLGICGLPKHPFAAILAGGMIVIQAVCGYHVGNYFNKLRNMAYLDSLTGVLVNRRFTELLHQEVERARRYDYPITLLFIDLDNFKQYNDNFGHLAGDQILCQFAALLRESVRDQDAVGRWGGEEFVVLLPHTDTVQGIIVGERIRNKIREGLAGITVSIGLATFPVHAGNAAELAERADTLMYEAKKEKDRMLVADK